MVAIGARRPQKNNYSQQLVQQHTPAPGFRIWFIEVGPGAPRSTHSSLVALINSLANVLLDRPRPLNNTGRVALPVLVGRGSLEEENQEISASSVSLIHILSVFAGGFILVEIVLLSHCCSRHRREEKSLSNSRLSDVDDDGCRYGYGSSSASMSTNDDDGF